MAEYATQLASRLGYSNDEVEKVRYIALLHDIGKVGIPDYILKKADQLTDEEYEIMKHHVDIGDRILHEYSVIPDLFQGAKYHHERYDGKGYNEGLKGEEIPDIARMICIVDSYDAMTSSRIYHPGMTKEQAIEELRKNSGTQFDPAMTEAFIQILNEMEETGQKGI